MFLISLFKKSAFLLGLTLSQVSTPPPAKVDLVARVQRYFDSTSSLTAQFEQVTVRARTGRTSRRNGRVRLVRPNLIRWDFRMPEPIHYVANDENLWVYQPQDALAYRMTVGDSDLDQAIRFLAGGIKIKSTFKTRTIEKPDGVELEGLAFLELKPKQDSASFRALILGVQPKTGSVRLSIIIDSDGNETRTTYSKLNTKPIARNVFEFTPPNDVQVQDLSNRGSLGR